MSSLVPYSDARTLLLAANLVPAANIHWSNEPFIQPQTSIWFSIECYSNELDILDLGANKWQEKGDFIVFCCAPAGTGTDSLRSIAKSVCNAFRNLPARNPYYHRAIIGSGGMSEDGQYFLMPVTISFIYED